MENLIENPTSGQEITLAINPDNRNYLKATAGWATFLSILGFIGVGLMILMALLMFTLSPLMSQTTGLGTMGIPTFIFGIIYLAFALLYFFPTFYLYNFANKTKTALNENKQEALDDSLKNLMKTFKFIGFTTIVIISAYLITIPTIIYFTLSKSLF